MGGVRGRLYQSDHLDTTGSELGLELGKSTQLGGTDGSEVIRVREEDDPAVADKVVERDVAVGRLGVEVGGRRAETEAVRLVRSCINWFSREVENIRSTVRHVVL